MSREFEINRKHKYESGDEIPVEFIVRGKKFEDVKQNILNSLGIDDPDQAIFTGIKIVENSANVLKLQTGETCQMTEGARISILVRKEWNNDIKANIAPNHAIWDTSKLGLEVVSREIRDSMQS